MRGGCLTPQYKEALKSAVLDYIPEEEWPAATENEFENGNEEISAGGL